MSDTRISASRPTTGSTGSNDPVRCQWCGTFHSTKCHLVKAVEFHPDGSVKRVEFYEPPPLAATYVEPGLRILDGPANTRGSTLPPEIFGTMHGGVS